MPDKILKVLVACEESQRVCSAFRGLGHEAYSCDMQEPSGGHPEWHILGNVLGILNPEDSGNNIDFIWFYTMNGKLHNVEKWDLIIAFPPCTFLTASSGVRLFNSDHTIKDYDRFNKGMQAKNFFMSFLQSDCSNIAVENPVPLTVFGLPPYSQIIQPFEHGDPWRKRTCLWLKNLPILKPSNIVEPKGYWIDAQGHSKAKNVVIKGFRNPKVRSKTFPGIAQAMADQWSRYLLGEEVEHDV